MKRFTGDKGDGLIAVEGSGRVRALSAITGTGDRSLEEGQKVEFDITHGQTGPSENVRVIWLTYTQA